MKPLMPLAILCLALGACDNATPLESAALPDNVVEDKPIVLKEGQAVILVPESNKSVMIGAAVVDGRLSISEIDPHGMSFGATWNDEQSWEVSTTDSKDKVKTIILDTDGDGLPNLKTEIVEGRVTRYELADIQWRKLTSKTKGGEPSVPFEGDKLPN